MAVVLGLGASLLWGASDFLGGLGTRRLPLLAVLAVAFPAGAVVIGAIVGVRGEAPPDGLHALYACLAGLGGVAGITCLYRGLAVGTMGVVAPITATAPLIPVTVGLLHGEQPGALRLLGIGVTLAGIVLASREAAGESRRSRVAAGAGLALAAGLCFGWTLVALDSASATDPYWATLIVRLTGCAAVAIALIIVRPTFARPGESLIALAPIGMLDATATMLFAVATTRGLVSVVSVLASLYPLVVVVLAWRVLGERIAAVQRAGTIAALAGVALISAG